MKNLDSRFLIAFEVKNALTFINDCVKDETSMESVDYKRRAIKRRDYIRIQHSSDLVSSRAINICTNDQARHTVLS